MNLNLDKNTGKPNTHIVHSNVTMYKTNLYLL